MDRRKSVRVSVQLPVHVWGVDAFGRPFSAPALVTEMSTGGIVLKGVQRRLRTGETLDIRMGATLAQFLVIWTSETGETGLERVTGNSFLPASVLMHCSQPAAAC